MESILPEFNQQDRIKEYQNDPVHKIFQEKMSDVLSRQATMQLSYYPEEIRSQCISFEEAASMINILQAQYKIYMSTKYGDIIKFE